MISLRTQGEWTMKNRHEFLRMMILFPLLLVFNTGVYAQLAKDPQQDLSVLVSTLNEGSDLSSVFGSVRNKSANAYPCVRLEFDLYTRSDPRSPGNERRHLDVLQVYVLDLQPRGERNYEKQLPFPAGGLMLKSVSECPPKGLPDAPEILSFTAEPTRINARETTTLRWRTANTEQLFFGKRNPEWPDTSSDPILMPRGIDPSGSLPVHPSQTVTYVLEAKKGGRSVIKMVTVEVTSAPTPPATCSITGQVDGPLTWNITDDRGNPISPTLRNIEMKAMGVFEPRLARIQGKTYIFTNVPAGQRYRIFPGLFRSQPKEHTVVCRPNTTHRLNFVITGPPLQG
jgi:hypothetical protein